MAEQTPKFTAKQYLDLTGLQAYDALIKSFINDAAESAKTGALNDAKTYADTKANAAQTAAYDAAVAEATSLASAAQTAAVNAAATDAQSKADAAQTAAVNAAAEQLESALADYKVKDIDNTASTNITFGLDTDGKLSATITGVVLNDADYESVKTNANNSALAWNKFLGSSTSTVNPTLAELATTSYVDDAKEAAISTAEDTATTLANAAQTAAYDAAVAEATSLASAAQTAAVNAAATDAQSKADAAQTAAVNAAKEYTDDQVESLTGEINKIIAGGVTFIGVRNTLPETSVNGNLFVASETFTVGETTYTKDYEYIYDDETELWYELGDSSKNGKAIAELVTAYKVADKALKEELEAAYKAADADILEAVNGVVTDYKQADSDLKAELTTAYEAADTELYNSIQAIPTSAISALFTSAQ